MFQEILNIINIISPIFYKVLYMTVVGSIVGLIVYFIRNIFDNKISGKWKCIMWIVVLVSLLVPIRYEIKTNHKINTNNIINRIENIKDIPEYNKFSLSDKNIYNSNQSENNNNGEIIINQNNENTDIAYSNNLEKDQSFNTMEKYDIKNIIINAIIPSVWLIGIFIFVITFISGTFSITKRVSKNLYIDERISNILKECKIQLHINKKIRIVLQDYKKVPSIFGIFNPAILITEKTLEEDNATIKYIFLHELSHYKRKDILFNYCLLLVLSIHWFNPIIWFLFKKIRQDIEIATDELVSKGLNQDERKQYGMVLINLLKTRIQENYTASMLCMSDEGKNMERRILMIKGKSKSIILSVIIAGIVIGVLSGFIFFKITEVTTQEGNKDFAELNTTEKIENEEIDENVTEEEKTKIEEYIDIICNRPQFVRLPEFKDINEADKEWIYANIDRGKYVFYATAEEIEENLKEIFGENLEINLKEDQKLIPQNKASFIPYYKKETEQYSLPAFDASYWGVYTINNIKKQNNDYIVNVIECFVGRDPDDDTGDEVLAFFSYEEDKDKFKKIFYPGEYKDYKDVNLVKKIFEYKDEFSSFNIKLVKNESNNFYVKEIEELEKTETSSNNVSSSNNNQTDFTISSNESSEITEYIDKMCNHNAGYSIPQFTDINTVDKQWIYLHFNLDRDKYYTKKQIEDNIKSIFGPDLVVNLDNDIKIADDPYALPVYDENTGKYDFTPFGYDVEMLYTINDIKKENGNYIVNVFEYCKTRDMDRNADFDYAIYSNKGTTDNIGNKIFEITNQTKEQIEKEVLERKNQFNNYDITITKNNGKYYLDKIVKK